MDNKNERGNVLWIILIAAALLGALTMVLSRGGSSVDQAGDLEQRRVQGSQVLRYANSVESAIQETLRLKIVISHHSKSSLKNLVLVDMQEQKRKKLHPLLTYAQTQTQINTLTNTHSHSHTEAQTHSHTHRHTNSGLPHWRDRTMLVRILLPRHHNVLTAH